MSGSCIRCRSYAINPRLHGRDDTDLDLCDVCYWRARAESNDTLRAQLEAAEAERLRLVECLEQANHNAEEFERKWYLTQDRAEAAEAECGRLVEALEGIANQDAGWRPGWVHWAHMARAALAARAKEQQA